MPHWPIIRKAILFVIVLLHIAVLTLTNVKDACTWSYSILFANGSITLFSFLWISCTVCFSGTFKDRRKRGEPNSGARYLIGILLQMCLYFGSAAAFIMTSCSNRKELELVSCSYKIIYIAPANCCKGMLLALSALGHVSYKWSSEEGNTTSQANEENSGSQVTLSRLPSLQRSCRNSYEKWGGHSSDFEDGKLCKAGDLEMQGPRS
jgi:hypothetical protein